jgi:hypothetical protein
MTSRKVSGYLLRSVLVLFVCGACCPALNAQELLASAPLPDAPSPLVEAAPPVTTAPSRLSPEHKFWDRQNCALLIAAAALNGADFAVTRANLQSGGQELNPVVRVFGRSTAGLAVNFAGETAGVISLTYFFHKTGHHRLERAVSLVNIGTSAGAVSFGLMHR